MSDKYYYPEDAFRAMLNEAAKDEEVEKDSDDMITEDDGLDWDTEIWVKGGGGTWKAKILKKRLQEHCRKIIAMAKEDRFSPSLAYTVYAYCDTLYDFVENEESVAESFSVKGRTRKS